MKHSWSWWIWCFNHTLVVMSLSSSMIFWCEFWLNYVAFLGNLISNEGFRVDLPNIKVVRGQTWPTSPTDMRSFVLLVWYYRQFIENFPTITNMLTRLNRKGIGFSGMKSLGRSFKIKLKTFFIVWVIWTLLCAFLLSLT